MSHCRSVLFLKLRCLMASIRSSHPLHCESVKIGIDFIIRFHLQVPHLSIEKLHFVDGFPLRTVFTPLHKTLSPTSAGVFPLMFVSGLKLLATHSSTISVDA